LHAFKKKKRDATRNDYMHKNLNAIRKITYRYAKKKEQDRNVIVRIENLAAACSGKR